MSHYAVAAGHDLTAKAAADVLAEGGSATDAVIAAALTATIAEPVLAGLMGGGFLMVQPFGGRPALLDFFVQTPRTKTPEDEIDFYEIEADFGSVRQAFHIGTGSIATPGVVPGLAEAHARHGRMPLAELAAPAIALARDGVRLTGYQARLGSIVAPILTASAEARRLMCGDDSRPLGEGALYRNPALADVIEVWTHEGARFFTEGEPAQALAVLARDGGHLRPEDLRRYRPVWRDALIHDRGGARIALNPPPSLGGLLIAFALDLAERDPTPVAIARVFEATARARVECALHEDPEAGGRLLLSDDLLERYRRELRGARAAVRGTTHISAIDEDGNGAALTLSNGEGCGRIVPGTGIMPNNMLGEDDLVPGDWLGWTPDTRLASMMAPMAVEWSDGRRALIGSGGSNRIRTALTQVLIGLIDRGLPIEAAIEAPRVHVESDGDNGGGEPVVDVELPGLGDGAREALVAAFPETRTWDRLSMFFGGAHGVSRDARGRLDAAGDPRRAGVALIG